MKVLRLAAACLALSACRYAEKEKYNASVGCAANEHAHHIFIDQSYDPDHMLEDDRKVWKALYASVWANARALHIPPDRVHRQIARRANAFYARMMDSREGGPVALAGEVVEKSRACMKRFGDGRGG